MNTRRIALLSLTLGFTSLGLATECRTNWECSSNRRILAQFTIARYPGVIVLPVTFEQRECWFLFDTGSSHTAFDITFRDKLGVPTKIIEGHTPAGPMMTELFDAPEAFLGPLNPRDCGKVSCFDFTMLNSALGRQISGVIGMNFLRQYTVQISPAKNAGIKANDVILKINDDVDQHDIQGIRKLLRSGNKRKIMMLIKRGNDVKKVAFILEKRI